MNLEERLTGSSGKRLGEAVLRRLREKVSVPDEWAQLLGAYPLAGARLSVSQDDDESGLGAEIQLMDDAEMISESFDVYPGIVALRLGYVPFGICLEGSGDPYFLRGVDGAVVRIPHDAVVDGTLDESRIEKVASSARELLTKATFE